MKLLFESTVDMPSIEFLIEEEKGKKNFFIEGVVMQAEKKNKNGRIYPKKVLKDAVDKYVLEQVNTGRAVSELGHPDSPTVNLDRVSHKIVKLEWSGNDVVGKALILNTPMGQIVKSLLEGGVQLGVSSRGMGSLEERQGTSYVKNDFILNAIDIVQEPSAPDAFVNGIMEGVEYFIEGGRVRSQLIERYETEIRNARKTRSNGNKVNQIREFRNFLSKL
jgi:hypothetical protein